MTRTAIRSTLALSAFGIVEALAQEAVPATTASVVAALSLTVTDVIENGNFIWKMVSSLLVLFVVLPGVVPFCGAW